MTASKQDLARLDDIARLQRLREDAAATRLANSQDEGRRARLQADEVRREAAQVDAEFREFLSAGLFEPGQYQLFGALIADHARRTGLAAEALVVAQQRIAADQQAHSLAQMQTREVDQRLKVQQSRHRRKAEDRQADDHQDLHILLQQGARA